ncbi:MULTISPECIES: YchJ family metal-binding protein [unclassified Pseudonocardia]|uniref:YchJ family protein n=1 Tax=unclassified Pseudonocardia TaxID=2619320 RepID=UPI00094AF7A3
MRGGACSTTVLCPCGTGRPEDTCCAPVLAGRPAATAEALMRSRYTAFVRGDRAYLLASWHPSTRPRRLRLEPGSVWTGLEIVARSGGTMFETEGTVEFRAHRTDGVLAERSRFVREDGRWFYVDGDVG